MSALQMIFAHSRARVLQGSAFDYDGDIPDLIVSNIYGPLPRELRNTPGFVTQFKHREERTLQWCGRRLTHITDWSGGNEAVWSINMPPCPPIDLSAARPDGFSFPKGFATELILAAHLKPNSLIWDGYASAGTVGVEALELGHRVVMMDKSFSRCQMIENALRKVLFQ